MHRLFEIQTGRRPGGTARLFQRGHGFGPRASKRQPVSNWIARFEEWFADSSFLKQP